MSLSMKFIPTPLMLTTIGKLTAEPDTYVNLIELGDQLKQDIPEVKDLSLHMSLGLRLSKLYKDKVPGLYRIRNPAAVNQKGGNYRYRYVQPEVSHV